MFQNEIFSCFWLIRQPGDQLCKLVISVSFKIFSDEIVHCVIWSTCSAKVKIYIFLTIGIKQFHHLTSALCLPSNCTSYSFIQASVKTAAKCFSIRDFHFARLRFSITCGHSLHACYHRHRVRKQSQSIVGVNWGTVKVFACMFQPTVDINQVIKSKLPWVLRCAVHVLSFCLLKPLSVCVCLFLLTD